MSRKVLWSENSITGETRLEYIDKVSEDYPYHIINDWDEDGQKQKVELNEDEAIEMLKKIKNHSKKLSDELEEKISNRSCDRMTDEHIQEVKEKLDWVVVERDEVDMSEFRSLYGGGLYTVMDYGRHEERYPNDEELIDHVKEDAFKRTAQYIKLAVDKDGTIPDKIVVVRKSNGLKADPYRGEIND